MNIEKESVQGITFNHGHVVVGTTRKPLNTLGFKALKGVLLRAPGSTDPTSNTAPIWIGGAGVTADSDIDTGGLPLLPGDAMFLPIEKLDLIYVVSSAANQDIAWMCI